MGERGPVPNREAQRRRQNAESKPEQAPARAADVPAPEPCADWHPFVQSWFRSLGESGQSKFYEASDWATAALLAESMSRDLSPQVVGVVEATGELLWATVPMKGAAISAYLKAMTALLVTEGDRRRARLELQRPAAPDSPDDADVADLDEYRRRLTG